MRGKYGCFCFNQTSEPFVPKVKIKSTISVTFLQDNIKILGKFHIFLSFCLRFSHIFSVVPMDLAASASCRIRNFLARSNSDLNNCSESGSDIFDKNPYNFRKFYKHISLEITLFLSSLLPLFSWLGLKGKIRISTKLFRIHNTAQIPSFLPFIIPL